MLIEDSLKRVEIAEELERAIRRSWEDHFGGITPDSTYAKNADRELIARDILTHVILREAFAYHPPSNDEKIFLIYKGEIFNYTQKIKKLIRDTLRFLGKNTSKNNILEVYYHIYLSVEISQDKLNILRRFIFFKNSYIFDMKTTSEIAEGEIGEILKVSYSNIKFFYRLFNLQFSERRGVKHYIEELEEWLSKGEITPEEDISEIEDAKRLWDIIISSIPWPIKIPVEYDPNAKAPRWEQFIREVLDEKYHTSIKRFIGYALYPGLMTNLPSLCVLLGEGSNGKTVFIKVLETLFGNDNISHVPVQDLNKRFTNATLANKLLNIAGELPQRGLKDTGLMKMISGGDTTQIEKKYSDPIPAEITAKHIFSTNELPHTSDNTFAFYRRWLMFIFPNSFTGDKADPMLLDKLIRELPGILNWVLEGYYELMREKTFEHPHNVEEIMELYEIASNSLARFISDVCEEARGEVIPFSRFYSLYFSYCKEHNLTPKADVVIGRELKKVAPYVERDKQKYGGSKEAIRVLVNIKVNYIPPGELHNLIAEAERKAGKKITEFINDDNPTPGYFEEEEEKVRVLFKETLEEKLLPKSEAEELELMGKVIIRREEDT